MKVAEVAVAEEGVVDASGETIDVGVVATAEIAVMFKIAHFEVPRPRTDMIAVAVAAITTTTEVEEEGTVPEAVTEEVLRLDIAIVLQADIEELLLRHTAAVPLEAIVPRLL